MRTFTLQENVLTDNLLLLPNEGKIFEGNYIAIIREFTFQNSQSDRELPPKKFRSKDRLIAYLSERYPDFDQILFD